MKYTTKDLEILTKLTQNLKNEIENAIISKKEIAERAGIRMSTLSQYLSGRTYPSMLTLKKLCEAIDVSSDTILDIK